MNVFRHLLRCAALLLLPVSVFAAPVVNTASPLPKAALGSVYSQTFTATGGTAPYAWLVTGGALPAGLTLSSEGLLAGTPTATGVFNFTVQVSDAVPEVAAKNFTLTVYLTTAGNGIGIPYPTSITTYPVKDGANTIQVPEGMVYVPAGAFTYGSGTTAASVTLDGYCINKFEVTNAEWKAFLNATGSTQYPTHWSSGTYPTGKANHPVLYVSLNRALAYAAWVSAGTGWNVTVPSAPQWEKAARGPNGYSYPWGNTTGGTYNSTTGVLTSNFNYNAVAAAYYLNNFPGSPAIYNNSNSPYFNQTVTVATVMGYTTAGVGTPFAVTASGGVNAWIQHDTYTGFVYTDVYDALVATGGYTTPVGSYESGKSAYGNYDMAGNVYEFTTTQFIASNGEEAGLLVYMTRGGSWYSTGASGRAFDTGEGRSATVAYHSVGFRIAMLPVSANSTLAITTASALPAGTVGAIYSQTLAANGGTASFTWSLDGGALPAGLTLSPAGVLSGTPTAGGTTNFTVRVTDSGTSTVTKAFSLTMSSAPLSITSTSPLPDAILNTPYSQSLAATGGIPPYKWSLNSGSLPAGLTLNAAGVISGTVTTTVGFNFTVQVMDSVNASATKSLAVGIAAFGPLHHFTWDYLPVSANVGVPIAARLTARDVGGNIVATHGGAASLSGTAGTPLASPIVITEVTDEAEDQFELQNISGATVNTTGWYVRIGDSTTNSVASLNTVNATTFSLPASLALGALLRVSETNTTTGGRTYFGSAIGWQNAPSSSRGWIMLFDNTNTLRDFFIFNWTAADLAQLNVTINGTNVTSASANLWSGAPAVNGTRPPPPGGTVDSWRRISSADTNASADWAWSHNADNSDATTFGATNPGLTVPWSSGPTVTISPASVTFSGGEYLGYLTLGPAVDNAVLTAADGSSHTGNSAPLNILAALADSDGDGIPDAWENAHGLNANVSDGALDSDGDGASNLAEYQAGTDPQSASSKLRIVSADHPAAGQFEFTWDAVAGRLYRISTSGDLATWARLSQLVLATTTGQQTLTLAVGSAPSLFVKVSIAP